MTDKKAVALFRRIKRQVGRAIADFKLIEDGDRIAVGVSGGKDSHLLLEVLETLRQRAPVEFSLTAVNVDPGFPGYRVDLLEDFLRDKGYRYHLERTDNARIIGEHRRAGTSYCAFCARLRRGTLYSVAQRLGCNKLALGHHLDDFIETLLLNQFYAGTLAGMNARMPAENGTQTVIRPLVYVAENEISALSALRSYPIIDCSCPEAAHEDQQRRRMKHLINELSGDIPEIRSSLISAMGNVHPRQLLDPRLSDSE